MKPALAIIGLGNPGSGSERTRHNAGFRAVDAIAEKFSEGEWQNKQKFLAVAREGRILAAPILILKPTTYMNRSGESVRKVVDFFKLDPKTQILILCDDIDLPLGEMRLRMKGGPGTHNGLKSIVETLGEEFPRLRIGIGSQPVGADLATWVLSVAPLEEEKKIAAAIKAIPEQVRTYVRGRISCPRSRRQRGRTSSAWS